MAPFRECDPMFLFRSRLLHFSFLFLCAALLAFGVAEGWRSPALPGAEAHGDGQGGIYLYRRGALAAYAQPFQVLVDGRTAGFVGNASFLRLPLAPGSHQIQVAPGGLAQVTTLKVQVDAGGRSFYEFVFPTGWNMRPSFEGAAIEERDEMQAIAALDGLRRIPVATGNEMAISGHLPHE